MSGVGSRGRGARAWALLVHALWGCSSPPQDAWPEAEPPRRESFEREAPRRRAEAVTSPAYVGVVIAPSAVELAAEVAGTLVEQGAALGERVEEGTLLARVQPPMLSAEIEAAEAALAQVEAARAEQDLLVDAAARTLEQEQRLTSAGVTSGDEREQARLELARARAVARRLTAQLAERRAELQRLHAQRGMERVVAPFSGTVSTWYRLPGAVVSRGDRLVRLVAEDRLWVRFAVPVGDLPQVQPGRVVDVVPVPEGPPQRATVRHVAPELDLASQRMLVEAELHEPAGLAAGQACHVTLHGIEAATDGAEAIARSAGPAHGRTGGARARWPP